MASVGAAPAAVLCAHVCRRLNIDCTLQLQAQHRQGPHMQGSRAGINQQRGLTVNKDSAARAKQRRSREDSVQV